MIQALAILSDVDREGPTIRWRAEHGKTDCEYLTPTLVVAIAILEEPRQRSPRVEDVSRLPYFLLAAEVDTPESPARYPSCA